MKVIYKYSLRVVHEQTLLMPANVKPLTVQRQDGFPTLWCEVFTEDRPVERRVFCVGIGNLMPVFPCDYIGTVQMTDGTVWHYYLGVWG